MSQAFRNTSYWQSSMQLLLFFASWGIWWSFFQIWLTNKDSGLGLNGSEVGTVYAANSFVTLIVLFFYGTIQDRLGIRRHLAILASVVATLVGPFFIFVYEPLLRSAFYAGVVAGALFLSLGFTAGVGLFEALSERLSRTYGFEFGQSRMWGSFGYAMVALAAGFLFTINPTLNFLIGSALGFLNLMVQIFWKSSHNVAPGHSETPHTPDIREMFGVLKLRSLWLIIIFVFFTWTFYTVYDQQMFPQFYTSLFESEAQGQEVYGILNSAQVFLEAAMMGLVPLIMHKVGVRATLMMGVTVMCLRILGTAVFSDPVLVSCVKMFHALEVPLFVLGIFGYFTVHFNTALSATLYMVGFNMSSQIGNVVLSQPLGALRDSIGYQPTFYVISGVIACAAVYAFFVLKKDDQQVMGEPFDHATGDDRVAPH